jgi:hypothetical protein
MCNRGATQPGAMPRPRSGPDLACTVPWPGFGPNPRGRSALTRYLPGTAPDSISPSQCPARLTFAFTYSRLCRLSVP